MSEVSNYLKCGTMAIVLSMVEDDFIEKDLSLESPVIAYRRVSRDLNCRETIKLKDGRALTAVEVQREFLEMAHRYYRSREHEPWVQDVLVRWGSVLDRLARDPMSLDRELDWVVKRHLIENYMGKHELDWADARVAMIDLQYHDVRPGKGLYYKLEESDAVERLVTDDEVTKALYDPPKDTRAYFRGMCLQKYADEVVSASWDSVIFDLKEGPLRRSSCWSRSGEPKPTSVSSSRTPHRGRSPEEPRQTQWRLLTWRAITGTRRSATTRIPASPSSCAGHRPICCRRASRESTATCRACLTERRSWRSGIGTAS